MKKIKVAIVGATGLVGKKILENLVEEGLFDKIELTLFVSDKSAGNKMVFQGEEYELLELNEDSAGMNFDIVLFSAGEDVSLRWACHFADAGAYVIDNSNAFRRDPDIPLVVPEINISKVSKDTKIIANPNCSTIQLVMVLDKISKLGTIEKVVVSTYQSVSGAGSDALADLVNDTHNVFEHGIRDNIIPQIGGLCSNGFCTEEDKLMFETSKILDKDIDLIATAVRIPTPYCHGESVYVKFKESVLASKVKEAIESDKVIVSDGLFNLADCTDTNEVYVSRIRNGAPNEILFFNVADNLRRGASYNAVLIAKFLMENFVKKGI